MQARVLFEEVYSSKSSVSVLTLLTFSDSEADVQQSFDCMREVLTHRADETSCENRRRFIYLYKYKLIDKPAYVQSITCLCTTKSTLKYKWNELYKETKFHSPPQESLTYPIPVLHPRYLVMYTIQRSHSRMMLSHGQ
eukprot:gene3964-2827_t